MGCGVGGEEAAGFGVVVAMAKVDEVGFGVVAFGVITPGGEVGGGVFFCVGVVVVILGFGWIDEADGVAL